MYYVYMLRCGDGSLYTGITPDMEKRLKAHQSGKGGNYTRSHLPVSLAYLEQQPDKSAALKRELELKALPRAKKLEMTEEYAKNAPPQD